jgi:hypothetical protein
MTTATADPFAAGTTTEDPFNQPSGGGTFPKFEELEDKLVLIRPRLVQTVPDRFHRPKAGEAQRTVERATCDVTVFEADGTHQTYRGMYISQTGIVPQLQQILDDNNPNRPFVLGVVGMLPNKDSKESKGILTREALKTAIAEWVRKGGKGDKPGYFWGLDPFTDAQAAIARPVAMAMLNKANPFA